MHTRTKIIIAVVALLIVSGVMAAFVLKPWEKRVELGERRGNTTGNIANMGRVAQDGDWIYYTASIQETIPWIFGSEFLPINQMRRVRRNGRNDERLYAEIEIASFMNVMDGWIYFATFDGMYKMRTDGTQLELIIDTPEMFNSVRDINLVDGWLFFSRGVRSIHGIETYLYRMSTDGEIHERIENINASGINVVDGWIYYADVDENFAIYRIRPDGTERMRLSDNEAPRIIIVEDGWVYYANNSDNMAIYKMRIDGTEHQMVLEREIHYETDENFNISDGWIYYSNCVSNGIYRVRTDGTERQRITEGFCFYIHIVDDWIYFNDLNYGHIFTTTFRVRMDGTDRERIQVQ
jgi:outer membrane protein assembly factor BamB